MNRWCFNAMFAGALAAGMLVAPAIGSAAVGAVAAEPPQAPASAAGHTLTAQPALASAPGHASTAQPALASAPGHAPTAPHAPTSDAMANIDACVARLDPQLDIGYDRIAARCPDLMRQLEAGAWAPWLPRGWKESGNDLSAGSLRELRELVARESNARESSLAKVPDVRSLQPILATLAGNRDETGWSRFKSWLRSILERREQPTDESWLSRMVSHVGISQSVIRIVTYAALAVIVVMAGTNNVGGMPRQGVDTAVVENVASGMKVMLELMQRKAPAAAVILMGITPRTDSAGGASVMPTIDAINERYARFAEGPRIRYVNINAQLARTDGAPREGVTVDGLHLSLTGYQVWADALKPVLTELLGPPAAIDHAPPPTGDPSAVRAPTR